MIDHGLKQYEVEIKSLIGGDMDLLQTVRKKLGSTFDTLERHPDQRQLNHYFTSDGDFMNLGEALREHLSDDEYQDYSELIRDASSVSLRTREIDGNQVIFVMKVSSSSDEYSDDHGLSRREFEITVPVSMNELDQIILDTGFSYKSKWSRERETYKIPHLDMVITIDNNAGYGYLMEFEKTTNNESDVLKIRNEIIYVMNMLDLVEVDKDRIGRMFAHYNEHWQDYYGTDKTFLLE